MFQELSDTSTPAHPPVSRRKGDSSEGRTVSEWVGNMNWASRASRGGNFHERPVQNENMCP